MLSTLLFLLLQSASIAGHVVSQDSNEPVGHAQVELAKEGGRLEDYRAMITGADGAFVFHDLSPGTYRVYAERSGFLRAEYGQRPGKPAGLPIILTANQNETNLAVSMARLGVITGRVLDRNGSPVRHVWVRALQSSYFYGHRNLFAADYAETDDLGAYRIFGLQPGPYFVSACPRERPHVEGGLYVVRVIATTENGNQSQIRTPVERVLRDGTLDAAIFVRNIDLAVYYPGVTDSESAASIDVRPGAVVTGIDLTTATVSGVRVRGRIISGVTGQPASNVSIKLIPRGKNVETCQPPGAEVSGGSFDIAGVPSGSYDLLAQDRTEGRLYARIPVDIGKRVVESFLDPEQSPVESETYYPGTTDSASARVVELLPGDTLNGIEIALHPAF